MTTDYFSLAEVNLFSYFFLSQPCNRSASFLFFWCAFALFQSTTVNGLVYVITTTIERRFSLTSAASGAVSSSFDLTVLALIVFVTYLTERLHKPLLIGSGAVIFALGSYVFTLPHFLSSRYEAEVGIDFLQSIQ